MKRLAWLLVGVLAFGCGQKKPMGDLPIDDKEVAYEGDTSSGVIPDHVQSEPPFEEDAGQFVIDHRCCVTQFAISDLEAGNASGAVRGNSGPLVDAGVTLSRDGGSWTASACMPVNEATHYWYEFTTPEDGGAVVTRISLSEPKQSDGRGGEVNFIASVAMCTP